MVDTSLTLASSRCLGTHFSLSLTDPTRPIKFWRRCRGDCALALFLVDFHDYLFNYFVLLFVFSSGTLGFLRVQVTESACVPDRKLGIRP